MLSWHFIYQVYGGQKRLPKAIGPESIEYIPKYPEFCADRIYEVLMHHTENNDTFARYFPGNRDPVMKVDKKYLFSVLKWLKPGMITVLLQIAIRRKKREWLGEGEELHGEFLDARLQNVNNQEIFQLMNRAPTSAKKASTRANYWMLSREQRQGVVHARRLLREQNIGGDTKVITEQAINDAIVHSYNRTFS